MAINIAIDGPSASGKSTVAKQLCQKLGYVHLDTGAMYRCVALYFLRTGLDINDEDKLKKALKDIKIDLTGDGKVYLNGQDVSQEIRTDRISQQASIVSANRFVREHLVTMQQKMAEKKGFIMDGRDIGTVVLPEAELKIYLTASSKARAMRRYLENKERGIESNLVQLQNEIAERDYRDMHRKISPLKKADDAILIDSSNLNKDEVVAEIMKLITEKI
ncbi:MAG: (d)CMP kinase [Erysipelotrichia bacterium]|nr:(d)CMP kinase [Erysipelotrichia bacterium]